MERESSSAAALKGAPSVSDPMFVLEYWRDYDLDARRLNYDKHVR
jgi:hypothetical protein